MTYYMERRTELTHAIRDDTHEVERGDPAAARRRRRNEAKAVRRARRKAKKKQKRKQ